LTLTAKEINDFVRAQSSPYPRAFIKTVYSKKLIVEKAIIEDI
jgi:methionyl-tRNA formyltransferase